VFPKHFSREISPNEDCVEVLGDKILIRFQFRECGGSYSLASRPIFLQQPQLVTIPDEVRRGKGTEQTLKCVVCGPSTCEKGWPRTHKMLLAHFPHPDGVACPKINCFLLWTMSSPPVCGGNDTVVPQNEQEVLVPSSSSSSVPSCFFLEVSRVSSAKNGRKIVQRIGEFYHLTR